MVILRRAVGILQKSLNIEIGQDFFHAISSAPRFQVLRPSGQRDNWRAGNWICSEVSGLLANVMSKKLAIKVLRSNLDVEQASLTLLISKRENLLQGFKA